MINSSSLALLPAPSNSHLALEISKYCLDANRHHSHFKLDHHAADQDSFTRQSSAKVARHGGGGGAVETPRSSLAPEGGKVKRAAT